MARLDLESSGESGGYSDSFEIEENISLDLTESSTESDARNSVESQLKKTLTSGIRTRGQSTGITTTKTTTASPNEFRSESHNSSVILDSGSVDLGRTIRSPVYITEQSASRGLKRPNFNQAAQKVHTMQSVVNTAKNFNDSLEVRDSVYGEWLARKAGQVSREKNLKVIAKKMEEEKKREKEVEIAQRSTKAVEQWNASKDIEFQKARKQRLQEKRKAKEQTKEVEEKKEAAEVASRKWREEKTRELASRQRERKKKEQEEVKRKEEELTEKAQSATQAFNVWSKRKDEVIRMEKRKQREHKQCLSRTKLDQEHQRKDEAKRAFEAWRSHKDEKLGTTKTLYTYKEDGKKKVHERAWCPARSIKHTYPKARLTDGKVKKQAPNQKTAKSTSLEASYSSASFESTDVDSETDSSIVDEVHSVCNGMSSHSLRKSIQVCCQTFEYWCTCEHT